MADQNETNQNYLEKQNTLLSAQIKYFEKLAQLQSKSLKAMVEESEEREDAGKKFKREMGELTGKAIKNATNAFVGVAQSMAGGDLLGTAGALMKAEVGMLADAARVGSNSLVDAGKKMQEAGKSGGAAVATFGAALGGTIGAIQQLSNVAIDFMIKQTGVLIKGFQGMSSAGATFTGGMKEMITTAHTAGMTLEQMSSATQANKDAFIASGLGVTEGSKKMAAAMTAGGNSARQGMFALGMSMEDQADAYATTIKRMTGPLGKLHASDAEVAATTEQYARDLKLISDLTGKTAKEQKASADAATNNAVMQQQLLKLTPAQRAATEAAIGGMSKAETDMLTDRLAHNGSLANTAANVLESISPNLTAYNKAMKDAFSSGNLTVEYQKSLQKQYGANIVREIANQEALATATQGNKAIMPEVNALMTDYLKTMGNLNSVDIKGRKDAIDKRNAEGKNGSGGMEVQLQEAQQKFATKLESLASNNLDAFGKALTHTITTIEGALSVFEKTPDFLSKLMSGWGAVVIPAVIGVVGSMAGSYLTRGLGPKATGAAGNIAGQASSGAGKAAGNVGAGIGEGLSGIGKGISAIGKGAGEAIGGILEGLAKGLSALGNPKVLLGTLSLVGVGAAIWVAGKAFMTFQDLDWESIAKGLIGVGAAGLGAAALGALALPMALGAGALLLVGASIAVMGLSLKALPDDILGTLANLGKGIVALWDAPVIKIGAAGPTLGALGLGLLPLSLGIAAYKASGGMGTLATDMKTLQGLDPSKLKDVAAGIAAIRDAQSPSLAGMAKNAIAGAFEKLAGNSSPPADTKGTTKTAPSGDLLTAMNMLVKVSAESLQNQKEMLSELRDHSGTSKKILRANQ